MTVSTTNTGRRSRYTEWSPPAQSDEWAISTSVIQTVDSSETETCAGTGETIRLDRHHLYITLKQDTLGHHNECQHIVAKNEDALQMWLGDE